MGQVTYRLLFLRESGPLATTRHTLLLYSGIERVDKFERYIVTSHTCAGIKRGVMLRRKERGRILTRSRWMYFCTAVGQTTVHYSGSSQFVWLLESGIAQIDSKYHFSGTVEPRLSGPRLSGLFDYPDFFSGPVFFMNINKL